MSFIDAWLWVNKIRNYGFICRLVSLSCLLDCFCFFNLGSLSCAAIWWKGGKTQVPTPMGDTTPIPVEVGSRPAIRLVSFHSRVWIHSMIWDPWRSILVENELKRDDIQCLFSVGELSFLFRQCNPFEFVPILGILLGGYSLISSYQIIVWRVLHLLILVPFWFACWNTRIALQRGKKNVSKFIKMMHWNCINFLALIVFPSLF